MKSKIEKPQNVYGRELQNSSILNIKDDEEIDYRNYEDEQYNDVNLYEVEFENCKFTNVCIQNGTASTILKNSYFQETKNKNIYFENSDLTEAQFYKTSLDGVDLSNSKIEKIGITIEDIKGAIIDQLQVVDVLYLLGVKLK